MLNIKIGGLYIAPWRYTFLNSNNQTIELEKDEMVVILEMVKLPPDRTDSYHYSGSYSFFMVKALTPKGEIVSFRASETALKDYWKPANNNL